MPGNSKSLYSISQIRKIEHAAINTYHFPESELMQRAGHAAFEVLQKRWPSVKKILVLVGKGNNGGDGLVVAELAIKAGIEVLIRHVGRNGLLPDDAAPFSATESLSIELAVDALLGIGLEGEVNADYRIAITTLNALKIPVLAIDVPSGIQADTGRVQGVAVHASVTVTYIGLKQGLLTGQAVDYVGTIECDTLGIPEEAYLSVNPQGQCLTPTLLKSVMMPRPKDAHKGDCGHVLVVGGNIGMSGAVRMAAEAAARVGAGLVSIATHRDHANTLNSVRPELMCHAILSAEDLTPLFAKADVIVVGPGLGSDDWSNQLWGAVLATKQPKIVDADGLNHLAKAPMHNNQWIITPHPGEAARLLQFSTEQVQNDRYGAVKQLQQRFGGVAILKGAGTLISYAHAQVDVCPYGNPGMASGGMGDVLSGVLGGLLAQGLSLDKAAECGVLLHALAADEAATEGERGLLAQDVINALRPTMAKLTR